MACSILMQLCMDWTALSRSPGESSTAKTANAANFNVVIAHRRCDMTTLKFAAFAVFAVLLSPGDRESAVQSMHNCISIEQAIPAAGWGAGCLDDYSHKLRQCAGIPVPSGIH